MKKLKAWQVVLLVIFYPIGFCVLIYRIWKKNKLKQEREAAVLARQEEARARQEAREREEAERKARIEAELASRETLTFKVVGVTFKNPDGKSRQTILRKLRWRDPPFNSEDGIEITIEKGEYQGEPAFSVYANGLQVGNIGRDDSPFFVERWFDFIGVTYADISGGGTDDEGHSINFGMKIDCVFRKKV